MVTKREKSPRPGKLTFKLQIIELSLLREKKGRATKEKLKPVVPTGSRAMLATHNRIIIDLRANERMQEPEAEHLGKKQASKAKSI